MSLLDDFSDFLDGVREMGQELDAFKNDIVSSFVEPVKDLNSTVHESSERLMGKTPEPTEGVDTSKNLPPAGE